VAAAPIPISSPTAIALIAYLSVVPASLILLLIIKYLYVETRKAVAANVHTPSSGPSLQLRTRHHPRHRIVGSDWDITRTAFLVGLLGSPDWEITKMKESEYSTGEDTNSQFSYATLLRSKSDPLGHIYSGSFLLGIVRALASSVSTTNSACSIGWAGPQGLRGYGFRLSCILFPLQTNRSFMPWTLPLLPLKALWGISYWTLRS
jgi:hypothetical protein